MQLDEYLLAHSLTYSEFARRCGTPHARTIERIAKRQKRAGPRMMPRIVKASGGAVQPNDLYLDAGE